MDPQKDNAEEHIPDDVEAGRTKEIREMFVRLRKFRGALPADFKFDREQAHERH